MRIFNPDRRVPDLEHTKANGQKPAKEGCRRSWDAGMLGIHLPIRLRLRSSRLLDAAAICNTHTCCHSYGWHGTILRVLNLIRMAQHHCSQIRAANVENSKTESIYKGNIAA